MQWWGKAAITWKGNNILSDFVTLHKEIRKQKITSMSWLLLAAFDMAVKKKKWAHKGIGQFVSKDEKIW